MPDKLLSEIRILYIEYVGDFVPVACVEEHSISESADTLDTTTRVSGGWRTFLPTTQNFSITFSGIQQEASGYAITYEQLKVLKRGRVKFRWRIAGGNVCDDEGEGFLTELSEPTGVTGFLGFSGTISGFGEPAPVFADLFQNGDEFFTQDGLPFIF